MHFHLMKMSHGVYNLLHYLIEIYGIKPINMEYLIVFNTEDKHYLSMIKAKEGDSYAIQAFKSKEAVLKAFGGYTEAFRRDATWRNSAAIGMIQMTPIAIQAPDNGEELRKYVLTDKLVHVSGGAIGRGYYGLHVHEDILSLKQFEVFNATMEQAGII